MTPEEVVLVRGTLRALAGRTGELSLVFYARLFTLDPALRPMFPADLTAQRKKFVATLREIIAAVDHRDRFETEVGPLGAAHVAYGTEVSHYAVVGEALLWALRTTMPEVWTPGVEEAWAVAYDLVAVTMLRGASHDGEPPG